MVIENIYKKIKTLDELKALLGKLKKKAKKVVHCHGVFDLIHPGHIRHLAAAKKEGDILVVTLTADRYVKRGPGRPIFNENLRAETLAAIESVDFVSIDHNPTAINTIKAIKPDVYVKGQEYEKKDMDITGRIYDEEKAVQSVGGRLAFTYDITFSSSKLINEYLDVFPKETRGYLKNIEAKYPVGFIFENMQKAKDLKVLVIGDAIIDQYSYCEPMGVSLKGHVVGMKYFSDEFFAGGVFATANNLASLCGDVSLITLLGNDYSHQDFIDSHLLSNVGAKYFYRKDGPTTIKRRYIDGSTNKKMFEICYLNDAPISYEQEIPVIEYLNDIIADYDFVVVSDFGHGFLNGKTIEFLCEKSKFLAVNVQTNSANAGFNLVSKYAKVDYVSIDEPEIRLAAHEKYLELRKVMEVMLERFSYKKLMVTRGPQGSLYYSKEFGFHDAPALASMVIDTVGAGDAFFAFTSPCIALGMSADLVSFIGNAVGALAVQIVCNREPVNMVDLMKFITRLLK